MNQGNEMVVFFLLTVWLKAVYTLPYIVTNCNNSVMIKYKENCNNQKVLHCLPVKNGSLVMFCAIGVVSRYNECPYGHFDEEGKWEIKFMKCTGLEQDCPGHHSNISSEHLNNFEGCTTLFLTKKRTLNIYTDSPSKGNTIAHTGSTIFYGTSPAYSTPLNYSKHSDFLHKSVIIIISDVSGFVVVSIIVFTTIHWTVSHRRRQNMPGQTVTLETRQSITLHDYTATGDTVVVEVCESRNNVIDIIEDCYGFYDEKEIVYDTCKRN